MKIFCFSQDPSEAEAASAQLPLTTSESADNIDEEEVAQVIINIVISVNTNKWFRSIKQQPEGQFKRLEGQT